MAGVDKRDDSPINPPVDHGPGQPSQRHGQGEGRASILFTAFEPSGDDHASAVIAELRRRDPLLEIHAWGGPKMAKAGATIVERTGDDAVVGLPGLKKIRQHRELNERITDWMRTHPVSVFVPVDSPGANFPLAKYARSMGITVVHLVAPQIWAWGRWRIHKLRARTDLVLCVLPFEEPFFRKRNVPAVFIGHPLFDRALDLGAIDARVRALEAAWHAGSNGTAATSGIVSGAKVALMPGSRPAELKRNLPVLLEAFAALRREFPALRGCVAAVNAEGARGLRERADRELGGWPSGLQIVAGDTEAVIRWCDLALVKSGTTTLQIARQQKPMVIFYRPSRALYHGFVRWIVSTKYFTLPNALAHREIVTELVPNFAGAGPIVEAARALLASPEAAQRQREELARVCAQFQDRSAAVAAADQILRMARGEGMTHATVSTRV